MIQEYTASEDLLHELTLNRLESGDLLKMTADAINSSQLGSLYKKQDDLSTSFTKVDRQTIWSIEFLLLWSLVLIFFS